MSSSTTSHYPFDVTLVQRWCDAAVKIQTEWRSYREKRIVEEIYEQALNPDNSFFKEIDYTESAMNRLEKSLHAIKYNQEDILEAIDKQIYACRPINICETIEEEIDDLEPEYQMWLSERELCQTHYGSRPLCPVEIHGCRLPKIDLVGRSSV